jgi:hypothetical protein
MDGFFGLATYGFATVTVVFWFADGS